MDETAGRMACLVFIGSVSSILTLNLIRRRKLIRRLIDRSRRFALDFRFLIRL